MDTNKKAGEREPTGQWRPDVSPIDVTSNCKETDVVLINRGQIDNQTTFEDLAKGVGGILNIDGLAVEIDALKEEVLPNGSGSPGGSSHTDRIQKLENHTFEGSPWQSTDVPQKGSHQKRLDDLEEKVGKVDEQWLIEFLDDYLRKNIAATLPPLNQIN